MEKSDWINIVYTLGMIAQAFIELQGMIAENKQRELRGESMAYTYDEITSLIEKHGIHQNALLTNLWGH